MRQYGVMLVLVMAAAGVCSAQEQSLADVARQKSSSQKAKHVYTEDDIPTHPVTAAPENDAPSSSSDAQSAADKKPPADASSSKPASAEVEAARKEVQAKQIQIDAVKQEIKKYQEQLLHETDDEKVDTLRTSIRNLEQNIGFWTEERNNAQKVIDKAAGDDKAKSSSSGDSPKQ